MQTMSDTNLTYPMALDQAGIEAVLPHRGEILFARSVTVLAHNHYQGRAFWASGLAAIRGHFPGMPVVPGVLLIEAAAQVAGAGMLVGDPHAIAMGSGYMGLLAGIRKCTFKQPVRPDEWVDIEVHCRQMTPTAASVTGRVCVAGREAASVEFLVVNLPQDEVMSSLGGATEVSA